MSSRKLNFDDETKQFVALYTNIQGEMIEKRFKRQTADKTHVEKIKYWRSVDALSLREKITKQAEYMEDTLVFRSFSERTRKRDIVA